LDPHETILQEIESDMPHWLPGQIRDYLGKYMFSGEDVHKKVEMLSGGERGRLALAKLALQDTNFLLLDEPTNHLDIPSQEVLESVLEDYNGTILLITHDRYLVDAVATQIWEIDPEESHLVTYNGTYSQMREEREKKVQETLRLASRDTPPGPGYAASSKPIRSHERKSKLGITKEERRRRAQLQELENSIAEMEMTLSNLGTQLESPMINAKEVAVIGREYERVQKEMDAKLLEWEKLQS